MHPATEGKHDRDTLTSTLFSLHSLFKLHICNVNMCVSINYSILTDMVFEQVACLGVKIYNYTEDIIVQKQ